MYEHFSRLRAYLRSIESLSPTLVDRAADPGATFYGSSWWLIRWLLDQSTSSEAALLRTLTTSSLTGAANVAARGGRPWPELLAEWSLATVVDDYPGFTPQRPQLTIASWNTRDIFAGLATDEATGEGGEPSLGRPFPLLPRALTFGDFTSDVITVVAGSASIFELSGAQSARQLIELRGASGAIAPSSLVLAIVRVQ
jgi:hypothetical protein